MLAFRVIRPGMEYDYAEGERERAAAAGLDCALCLAPLVSPLVHGPCGTMCCRPCFSTCPHCHCDVQPEELAQVVPRMVNVHLASLRVHCPSCHTVLKRGALEEHAQTCAAPCPRGCGSSVTPAERGAHEAVCGAVEERCPAFGCTAAPMPRLRLAEHSRACPFVAVAPAFDALLATLKELEARLDALESRARRKKKPDPDALASKAVLAERRGQPSTDSH